MKVFLIKALDENGKVKGMEIAYESPSKDFQKFVSDKYCTPYVEITEGYILDKRGNI